MKIIEVDGFGFAYPGGGAFALSGVSFDVNKGSFSLLCGRIGSGKTTLLRCLKNEIAPRGETSGKIKILGEDINALAPQESAKLIGILNQNPENQIVLDSIWGELAFGLENLGVPSEEIGRRIAEISTFFGIEHWMNKRVYELSGGQKQTLSLAAILAMQPEIILLDEPTARLDPIAEKEFYHVLTRVNRELGKTILLSTHRLEEGLAICDQVIHIDKGRLTFCGTNRSFVNFALNDTVAMLPDPTKQAIELKKSMEDGNFLFPKELPLDIKSGRRWLEEISRYFDAKSLVGGRTNGDGLGLFSNVKDAIRAKDIWFRYGKSEDTVLAGLTTSVKTGEIHAFIGGNGTGKTTLLKIFAGLVTPQKGKVSITDGQRIAMLFQDTKAMFYHDTVIEDLIEGTHATKMEIDELADRLNVSHVLNRNPFDLSGGEAQKSALMKAFLAHHDILLLDEPVKGLDAESCKIVGEILEELKNGGCTIVMVTHDIVFAALHADRCSMLFAKAIIASGEGKEFFNENVFYTTPINRMTRGIVDGCVNIGDLQIARKE